MMGEELNSPRVAERGLAGDRAYALVAFVEPEVLAALEHFLDAQAMSRA
jgi:hypothetical protein